MCAVVSTTLSLYYWKMPWITYDTLDSFTMITVAAVALSTVQKTMERINHRALLTNSPISLFWTYGNPMFVQNLRIKNGMLNHAWSGCVIVVGFFNCLQCVHWRNLEGNLSTRSVMRRPLLGLMKLPGRQGKELEKSTKRLHARNSFFTWFQMSKNSLSTIMLLAGKIVNVILQWFDSRWYHHFSCGFCRKLYLSSTKQNPINVLAFLPSKYPCPHYLSGESWLYRGRWWAKNYFGWAMIGNMIPCSYKSALRCSGNGLLTVGCSLDIIGFSQMATLPSLNHAIQCSLWHFTLAS
jgi:hypothetical protein